MSFGAMATFIVASTLHTGPALEVSLNDYVCMVEAIHFEAKGENYEGKVAVANVIKNRVAHSGFPGDVCGVVTQRRQFSYRDDGKPTLVLKNKIEEESFKESARIALLAVNDSLADNTGGADHYYAHNKVEPYWKDAATHSKVLGNHTFVRL